MYYKSQRPNTTHAYGLISSLRTKKAQALVDFESSSTTRKKLNYSNSRTKNWDKNRSMIEFRPLLAWLKKLLFQKKINHRILAYAFKSECFFYKPSPQHVFLCIFSFLNQPCVSTVFSSKMTQNGPRVAIFHHDSRSPILPTSSWVAYNRRKL